MVVFVVHFLHFVFGPQWLHLFITPTQRTKLVTTWVGQLVPFVNLCVCQPDNSTSGATKLSTEFSHGKITLLHCNGAKRSKFDVKGSKSALA